MQKNAKWLASSVCAAAAMTFLLAGHSFAATNQYVVKSGDSLWKIAHAYQVSLPALDQANPGISAANLQVGQYLTLPTAGAPGQTYTIKSGDTLWKIAQAYGVSLTSLETANPGIDPANLQPGQMLQVPAASGAGTTASGGNGGATTASSGDLYWMTQVIAAEAAGQPMAAKLGVGAVIMNRLHDGYASTVQGVVFQQINGIYQFTVVANGWIYQAQPTASDAQAAREVLAGTDILPGAMVFYNPADTPSGSWVRQQPAVGSYGSFIFAS